MKLSQLTEAPKKPKKLKVGDKVAVDWVSRMGIGHTHDFAEVTELNSKHPHWTPGEHSAVVGRTQTKISIVWDDDKGRYIGLQF